jgi:SAM-dependent methyltransferase
MGADAKTAAFYRDMAGSLAAQYGEVPPDAGDRLERAFRYSRKILDIGCGTGRDLAFLLRKGKDAYGADASKEMIAAANATITAAGLSGAGRLFEVALPDLSAFSEGEFDGVLCSAVLMHLPDEEIFDAVYALRRVLRPGGTLLVSVPSARNDVDPITRREVAVDVDVSDGCCVKDNGSPVARAEPVELFLVLGKGLGAEGKSLIKALASENPGEDFIQILVFGLFGHTARLSHWLRSHQSRVLSFAAGKGLVTKKDRA